MGKNGQNVNVGFEWPFSFSYFKEMHKLFNQSMASEKNLQVDNLPISTFFSSSEYRNSRKKIQDCKDMVILP